MWEKLYKKKIEVLIWDNVTGADKIFPLNNFPITKDINFKDLKIISSKSRLNKKEKNKSMD